MSTTRPLPKKVYVRRRLTVLAVLVAIVAIVVLVLVRPGSNDGPPVSAAAATPSAAPTSAATPQPEPTVAEASTPIACAAGALVVTPVTDTDSYAAGQQVQLSFTMTNSGTTPCTMNAGTSQQKYTITSGADTYWTSTDCQVGPSDTMVLLDPGQTVTSAPFAWDRTRSTPATCDITREAVPGGGASYHVHVDVAGIPSTGDKQIILY